MERRLQDFQDGQVASATGGSLALDNVRKAGDLELALTEFNLFGTIPESFK
jgi:hypothetical protein